VLGVSDGVLNALILAAGAILRGSGDGVDVGLALRVGTASFVTSAFTVFVAYYSERRTHLVRAARELNLTEPGRLAATNLGRAVAMESGVATLVAALASLAGAAVPLLLGALLPVTAWVTLAVTVGLLGVLGWAIGATLAARRALWCLTMVLGGVAVTAIGAALNIAS